VTYRVLEHCQKIVVVRNQYTGNIRIEYMEERPSQSPYLDERPGQSQYI